MTVLNRTWLYAAALLLCTALVTGCASQQRLNGAADPQPTISEPQPTVSAAATPTQTAVPATPTSEPQPTLTAAATTSATVVPATLTSEPQPTKTSSAAQANADVLFVRARQEAENSWHFTVTVEHPDTGWEDYADGWDVVLPDGTVAKPDPDSPFTRLLLHPHETEQPFTRSQGGVLIESGITEVTVRAHDLVDGFGGREVTLDLSQDAGSDYEVQRLQP